MREDSKKRLEAFETEAMGYTDQLFRVALRLCRERAKAEDLLQETYLQAWRSFHRFELGTNMRAWLYKILFNVFYSGRRHERLNVVPVEEMISETIAWDPQTPQNIEDEDVLAALDRVPRDYQIPVVLADVEELSYREIAEAMGIPLGTVMSRLHRGRKILRMELTRYAQSVGYRVAE